MTDAGTDARARPLANALLALGAALGIAAAIASLSEVQGGRGWLADDHVAEVNGVPIRLADYLRALGAFASDRRSALTDDDRRHVVDRLIDEELLVQYGVELGLLASDRRVRGDLVSAVLSAQVASVQGFEPTAAEVEAFYAEHGDFFANPGRLRLQVLWVRGEPLRDAEMAMARAAQAAQAWSGGTDLAAVREQWGDSPVAPLPDGYLPPAKVREYLGPAVTSAALALEPGQVSDAIRAGSGAYVVRLIDREERWRPPLAEIEAQVRAEMQRRAGDDAVRATLERLRADGRVIVAEALP